MSRLTPEEERHILKITKEAHRGSTPSLIDKLFEGYSSPYIIIASVIVLIGMLLFISRVTGLGSISLISTNLSGVASLVSQCREMCPQKSACDQLERWCSEGFSGDEARCAEATESMKMNKVMGGVFCDMLGGSPLDPPPKQWSPSLRVESYQEQRERTGQKKYPCKFRCPDGRCFTTANCCDGRPGVIETGCFQATR